MNEGRTKSWAGLTARQVVIQSTMIHPDWSADDHRNYLVMEEGLDKMYVDDQPIEIWIQHAKAAMP